MRPTPYIGVTGFMHRWQVEEALAALPENCDRRLMVGVLVSHKALRNPGLSKNRYPLISSVAKIFPGDPRALNLIHFNTKEKGWDVLLNDLRDAQEAAGPLCRGFQLNIAWPDKRALARYKKRADPSRSTIVLQCGAEALAQIDRDPRKLARCIREYGNSIDYVLIDPSGGRGVDMSLSDAEAYLDALAGIGIGLGIAGGLCDSNLGRLSGLLKKHPCVSIDAEGKLHAMADNLERLDMNAVQRYVRAAAGLFANRSLVA